jgi:uncharacterized protein YoxC
MADVVKFFDNKQLVHIASEVVVLVGLTFYFSSKNKKLLSHIEELSQRIEEQEDRIQKMEVSLQQVNQKFDALVQQVNAGFNQMGQNISTLVQEREKKGKKILKQVKTVDKPVEKPVDKPVEKHTTPVLEEVKPSRHENKVNFYSQVVVEKEDDTVEEDVDEEELSDSDLDDEIRDELNELDSSLKKQT